MRYAPVPAFKVTCIKKAVVLFFALLACSSAHAETRLRRAWITYYTVASTSVGPSASKSGAAGVPSTRTSGVTAGSLAPPGIGTASAAVSAQTRLLTDGFQFSTDLIQEIAIPEPAVGKFGNPYCTATLNLDFEVVDQDESIRVSTTLTDGYGYANYRSELSNGSTTVGVSDSIRSLTPGSYRYVLDVTLSPTYTFVSGSYYNHLIKEVRFTNLVRFPGSSQDNPILGTKPGGIDGRWEFIGNPSFVFCDPPLAQGYSFATSGGAAFRQIASFPTGLGESFRVIAEGTDLGTFSKESSVNFEAILGHAVSSFDVRGIQPFVDATSPTAFPIMLEFTTPTASFTMTAISAPDVRMKHLANGDLQIDFDGVLQSSPDLRPGSWVDAATTSPLVVPKAQLIDSKFFRARDP